MPEAETDFALWFLEKADTGYCVHFATAAVVLLRAADIPARYVTGYLAHPRAGEETPVTAGEAHAWAEYFSPRQNCWLILDATPAQGEPMPVPATAPEETNITEPAATPGQTPDPTVPSAGAQVPDSTRPTAATGPQVPRKGGLSPALLLLPVALALILQRKLRLFLRRKRLERSGPNEQALYLWRQAVLLSKLLRQSPPEALHTLAQKAKYSPHPLTEEELHQFHSHITRLQAALKAKPRYLQPLYRLVYAVY